MGRDRRHWKKVVWRQTLSPLWDFSMHVPVLQHLKEGRCLDEQILQSCCEPHIFMGNNSHMDMYAKCGSMNCHREFYI